MRSTARFIRTLAADARSSSPLESARDAEVQRLALQVSGILTRSLAATEQAHDEEAVQNGGTTTIEAKLGESVRKTGRLVAVGRCRSTGVAVSYYLPRSDWGPGPGRTSPTKRPSRRTASSVAFGATRLAPCAAT